MEATGDEAHRMQFPAASEMLLAAIAFCTAMIVEIGIFVVLGMI